MAQYKLKFTGQEIDNRLAQVPDVYTVKDVGTAESPITLDINLIKSKQIVNFLSGKTYYINPINLKDADHIHFILNGATVVVKGSAGYFLQAENCNYLTIEGGTILGYEGAETGRKIANQTNVTACIKLQDSQNVCIKQTCIKNIGCISTSTGRGIYLIGDCTNFIIEQCFIQNIASGVVSEESDKIIHAYGIFVNRDPDNYSKYSKYGVIRSCIFDYVAGITNAENRAEGEGIFIQQLPYKDNDNKIQCLDSNIIIEGCSFNRCCKRGVKATSRGVHIKNCQFYGDYWFAPIEFQYGHGLVENCRVNNNHVPEEGDGYVGGIVLNDGNVIVRDTYINCRYGVTKLENPGASAGEKATLSGCHNGIIFNNRNDRTPFEGSEPWDSCIFERVVFDGVYNAIRIAGKAYKDQKESWRDGPYCIKGIDITDCKINDIIGSYAVVVYKGTFASIDSLRFVDFRFTQGDTRQDVNFSIAKTYDGGITTSKNGEEAKYKNFSYPIYCENVNESIKPSYTYELYSKYWNSAPTFSYGNIPTPVNTKIIYVNEGSLKYKEYTCFGSKIIGTRRPFIEDGDETALTSSLAIQALYNSRIGDEYSYQDSKAQTLEKYVCVEAGTDNTIGTWQKQF